MSDICGFLNLDQGHVADVDLGTTAVRHAESGCSIIIDASLYYRDELIAALRPDTSPQSDAELILAAYLRWGEGCLDRIEGDFAYAIWDPRDKKLFCARDHYGLRPFYYHHSPGKCFAFASAARDVLRYPQVPFAINEGRIADFIVPQLEWIDYTSTFYEDVYRLPPAHTLVVSPSGIRVSEYWQANPGPELALSSDDEYCDEFLKVFSRAVDERLKVHNGRAGATLSGGVDSGSIAAVANEILTNAGEGPLPTYSLARSRAAECEESQRIYATLEHLDLGGTRISPDEVDELIDGLGTKLGEPFDGEFLFLQAIYETARRNGVNVVLDGAAGDIVFNEGRYITRLMRRGRVGQAWREIVGSQAFGQTGHVTSQYLRYLAGAFAPEAVKRRLRGPRQHRLERRFVTASLISPEFSARIDIEARFERMRETFSGLQSRDPAVERVRKIRPNLTAGRERYARIAASAGVEPRDPYTDQRVVEFCARLPDDLCARQGWPKFLLRKAMAEKLPDEVRWARGKPHLGWRYNELFIKREKSEGRLSYERLLSTLEGYIDPARLQQAWRAFEAGEDSSLVHSAFVLALWLEQSVTRPVVDNIGFR